jgi:stress-induced morphogen
MIPPEQIVQTIQEALGGAEVTVTDLTGTRDHYSVKIISPAFEGKNPLDRRRMIHKALKTPMEDGRIHAMEVAAKTPDEA